jgi:hypothetical protein
MNLAQRCFFWVVGVAVLAMLGGLLLAAIELGRLNRTARAEEAGILLSEVLLTLDRRSVSVDGLAFVAKRELPRLPADTSVALINSDGEIVVSSTLGREGNQAPEGWMGDDHAIRADRWSHWFRGTLTLGAPILDRQGKQVGAVAVEHIVPSVPAIATILLAALRWGGLVLVAFLPACWFASRLIARPLADDAAKGVVMLDSIRRGGADALEACEAVAASSPELARFGAAAVAVQAQFGEAIDAVSGGMPVREPTP